ncbi:MAG: hypothetical protein H7A27_06995 [Spirochaetaceae bacterium]|nr:hypothetical protein [Spirochaetaceae bacterium]
MSAMTLRRVALAVALAAAPSLAGAQAVTASGAAAASISLGAPLPYTFNEAVVSSRAGLSGRLTLYGLGSDGERAELYRADLDYADAATVTYYAWPGLESVVAEGRDGDGLPFEARARLERPGFGSRPGAETEPDLSTLEFPMRRRMPSALEADRRPWPLALLSLWAVLFTLAPLARAKAHGRTDSAGRTGTDSTRRRAAIAAAVATIAVAAGLAYALGSTRSAIRAAPDESGATLLGVRSPLEPLPLSSLDGYARLRFQRPPLVVPGDDGLPALAPAPFQAAWALPGRPRE